MVWPSTVISITYRSAIRSSKTEPLGKILAEPCDVFWVKGLRRNVENVWELGDRIRGSDIVGILLIAGTNNGTARFSEG